MVRMGGDLPRSAKYVRCDDILTDTFTPRTYQVELLEAALQGNTIACLGSESSKVFLGLMVIREMSHQIRAPLEDGGKRSIYLVDTENDVEALWSTLYHHTDLAVGRVSPEETAQWSEKQWLTFFSSNNILILSATIFLHCLNKDHLPLPKINLLVVDDCHKAIGDHAYVSIMWHVLKCGDQTPHLLCLTAAILGSECGEPQELADRITVLESTLNSKAETSMLVISERFGCRPKESVIVCKLDDDMTGMADQLASILYSAWHFLEDSQVTIDDYTGKSDPLHVPKFAISECINILQTLGSWCAASIAENLMSQLEKIVKHESNQTLKLFLRYTLTQLRLVLRVFEIGFTPDYVVEELLNYTTPKVREFVNILRKYKPEMDFMIITREGEEDEVMSDMSDDDANDDDSLDLSSSDDENQQGKSSKHIHIAVKKKADNDSPFDDEKKLSGLVFVDSRYVAFALNKMMEEICSWDENLCFVKSGHITGQGIHRPDGRKDLSNASRKQEEILRKFRMQERNLLISTSVLEEGVDIPKCNLVVRFDPPRDYRSYTLSKGRARARDAEYVILVDEELMDDFSDEIQVFKGIEQVLIGAGRGRQDLEDAQEVQQLDEITFTPLAPFCPLNQPGAASVSMKSAIALVNRYCAKLPSDAFTHLTPHCRVCSSSSDPGRYEAYLRLPVNSPIKEELRGPSMPSRQLAKMAVALQMCELLYKAGELDCHLQPVGKELFVYEEEDEWDDEEEEGSSQARPGTTKRKQYYIKKPADAFVSSHPRPEEPCFLYHIRMTLTGPITEDQNTRGRKIYAPEDSWQSFGILLSSEIPQVPSFPVYTRSGEVTVSMELLSTGNFSSQQLDKLVDFHHFVFSSVLHLEKDPMVFSPEAANIGLLIIPLNQAAGSGNLEIEWNFVEEVNNKTVIQKRNIFDDSREIFQFEKHYFEDAVVMPSYRNIDQPQHFYVAEIRTDLSPLSPFPSPELYKTFAAYYTTKYGLTLTNMEQPLLDVDHTSARLNLLTPRYMNQKGRALPTSSQETKRARRENLQQKQILVPELCDIHVFSASLWRKAVCLPAVLYRMNYLLLAEELRKHIASETGIGKVFLEDGFRFPPLDFGFETNPEKLQTLSQMATEKEVQPAENCCHKETEIRAAEETHKVCDAPARVDSITQIADNCLPNDTNGTSVEHSRSLESLAQDSNPDDDKTDTGASSDSDSGVVLSESDATCAQCPKTTASISADSRNEFQMSYSTHNLCSVTTEDFLLHEKSEKLNCISTEIPLDKDLSGINSSSTITFSGTALHNAKACNISDSFFTPSTSRSSSPLHSDSDDSVYEDAEESLPPSSTTLTSSKCDIETVCQMHKFPATSLSASLFESSDLSTFLPSCYDITGSLTKSNVFGSREENTPETDVNLALSSQICVNTPECSQKVPVCSPDVSDNHTRIAAVIWSQSSETDDQNHCSFSDDLLETYDIPSESHQTENCLASSSQVQVYKFSEQTPHNFPIRKLATQCTVDKHINGPPVYCVQNCLEKNEPGANIDDFLDLTESNLTKKPTEFYTSTFLADPEISDFTKPVDEVKLTFVSPNDIDHDDLDVSWTSNLSAVASRKEWAPNENLTTFSVNDCLQDLTSFVGQDVVHEISENLHKEPESISEPLPDKSEQCSVGQPLSPDGNSSSTSHTCTSLEDLLRKDSCNHVLSSGDRNATENKVADSLTDCEVPTGLPTVERSGSFPDEQQNFQVDAESGWGSETAGNPGEWTRLLPCSTSNSSMCKHHNLALEDSCDFPFEVSSQLSVNKDNFDISEINVEKKNIVSSTASFWDKDVSRKEGEKVSILPSVSVIADDKNSVCTSNKNPSNGQTSTFDVLQQNQRNYIRELIESEQTKSLDFIANIGKDFDIGTWNTEPRSTGEILDTTCSANFIDDVTESSPNLISLDHDKDLETFIGPSPCLLLQALTMSNANDFFSLERLETIGDSFLKYAITVYLYCCYPGTHEGKLSYLRSKQVSNYNLYRLGRRKGLAERMVSTKFEPYENWLPPGYIISEERRRGPVPKVVIATSNPKLSASAPVNFLIEDEESESDEDQRKETKAFHAEVEEIDRQQAVDQQIDLSSCHKHAMIPYCLQLHHGIPDKSVADCVEALIGCYLTTCGKQAALIFMSWLGLRVLPRKRMVKVKQKRDGQIKMNEFQELQCPPSPLLRNVPNVDTILQRLLEGFSEFETRISYTFRDRSYLLQAFTHASYHYNYITDCYQRLEFLGDAILDYVITRHLYEDSQRYSPGILTDLRSALVNNNIFAALAVKWDFHKFFKAISPSLFVVIDKFVVRQKEREDQIDEIEEVKKHKKLEEEDEDCGEGGITSPAPEEAGGGSFSEKEEEVELEIPKALGDIFESVAGAIYLDSGMSLDAVWRVYYRMMKPHIDKYLKDIPKSPVRELLEMEPETAKFEKPERTLEGKIRVTVNVVGKGVFCGVGRNYRIAKSAAAKKALRFIRSLQTEGQA